MQVLSEAQHEPGYCAFYEECGYNPLLENTLIEPIVPCLNYSGARLLTGAHYEKLKRVCSSVLLCLLLRIKSTPLIRSEPVFESVSL